MLVNFIDDSREHAVGHGEHVEKLVVGQRINGPAPLNQESSLATYTLWKDTEIQLAYDLISGFRRIDLDVDGAGVEHLAHDPYARGGVRRQVPLLHDGVACVADPSQTYIVAHA